MKYLSFLALILLAGCGAYHVTVVGASGKPFTAPDLCTALVACQNSSETACYYNRVVLQTATGQTEESTCKEVKK